MFCFLLSLFLKHFLGEKYILFCLSAYSNSAIVLQSSAKLNSAKTAKFLPNFLSIFLLSDLIFESRGEIVLYWSIFEKMTFIIGDLLASRLLLEDLKFYADIMCTGNKEDCYVFCLHCSKHMRRRAKDIYPLINITR